VDDGSDVGGGKLIDYSNAVHGDSIGFVQCVSDRFFVDKFVHHFLLSKFPGTAFHKDYSFSKILCQQIPSVPGMGYARSLLIVHRCGRCGLVLQCLRP
jgi:hypothetical protein